MELNDEIAARETALQQVRTAFAHAATRPTRINAGDLVAVSIMDLVGLDVTKTTRIDGDGTINLPYVGSVKAAGLSPRELEQAIVKAYEDARVVQNAIVTVSMPEHGESHQLARRPTPGAMPGTEMAGGGFMDPMMGGGMEEAMMGEPSAPIDAAMQKVLARKLPEVKFDEVPFVEVIEFLRETTGSNLFVNWRALESTGIDRNAPVTLKLRDIALRDLLSLLLLQQGAGLAYKAENGVITIDVPDQPVKASKLVIKAYDVADLLAVNQPHAAGQAPGGFAESMMGGFGAGSSPIMELTNTIISTVAPESWRNHGGHGSIGAYGTKVIITADEEVHRDVASLFEMLREKPATQPATGAEKRALEPAF